MTDKPLDLEALMYALHPFLNEIKELNKSLNKIESFLSLIAYSKSFNIPETFKIEYQSTLAQISKKRDLNEKK